MSQRFGKQNARRHPRTAVKMQVSVRLSESEQTLAVTRDISEDGLFLVLDPDKLPAVGETVKVQVQGLPAGVEAPWVEMQVVRTEAQGVGLMITGPC